MRFSWSMLMRISCDCDKTTQAAGQVPYPNWLSAKRLLAFLMKLYQNDPQSLPTLVQCVCVCVCVCVHERERERESDRERERERGREGVSE